MNLEEGATFTVGDSVPGIQGEVCVFRVSDGSLLVTKAEKGSDIVVNGIEGREFRVKVGDQLKSATTAVEFLDVPWRQETPAETQFIDVAKAGLLPQKAAAEHPAAPVVESAEALVPAAPAVPEAPVVPVAAASEAPSEVVLTPPETPVAVELDIPEARRAEIPAHRGRERGWEATDSGVPRDKSWSDLGVQGHSSMTESTRLFLKKTEDAEMARKELFSLCGLMFLALGVAGGAAQMGSPLLWGSAGVMFGLLFSAILPRLAGFTGSTASFSAYLRFMTYFYFALIPWGFAFRLHPIAAIVASVFACAGFTAAFMIRFKISFGRFSAVGGAVSLLPIALAAVSLTDGFTNLPFQWKGDVAQGSSSEELAARQPASESGAVVLDPAAPAQVQPQAQAPAPVQPQAQPLVPAQAPVAAQAPITAEAPAPLNAQASVAPPVQAPLQPQGQLLAQPAFPPPAQPVAQAPVPVQQVQAPAYYEQTARRGGEDVGDPLATEQFFSAAKKGNVSVVKALIAKKAVDPNFTLDKGNTVLMYAAANGHTRLVKYLLSQRVNVNARDPNGTTALMWAVYKGHTEVVNILLKSRADTFIRRDDGDRAIDIAKRWKRWDIADLLEGKPLRTIASKPASSKKAPSKSGYRKPSSTSKGAGKTAGKTVTKPRSGDRKHRETYRAIR
ncbi:MAG: ankyrin repeat domain-containing protein [Oligoflexia bacterium]|nr:ankyrin repeat domain-containing protein [Oligoflexia bacterium]